MKRFAILALYGIAAVISLATGYGADGNLIKPADYLASQPKPNFEPGHHLPHLTRWGNSRYRFKLIQRPSLGYASSSVGAREISPFHVSVCFMASTPGAETRFPHTHGVRVRCCIRGAVVPVSIPKALGLIREPLGAIWLLALGVSG